MAETVEPAELLAVLPALIELREPVFIAGPPGIGKSQIVRQAAAKMGKDAKFWDVRAVTLDPVDVRGLPNINAKDGLTHWLPPAFLPKKGERGVLFLDELPQAPPAMQSALLQLTLDRAIGDYVLPDGVSIIAAGNRPEDRSGSARLITALADRFVKLTLVPSFECWIDHVTGTGEVGIDILSFLRWKPAAFHCPDPSKLATPNPRNWVKASKVLGRMGNVPRTALDAVLRGIIGSIAVEVLAFLDLHGTLPTPEKMLADPTTVELPSRLDANWAISGSLIAYFDRPAVTTSQAMIQAFFTLLARFPAEVAIVSYSDVQRTRNGKEILAGIFKTAAGKAFAAQHKELFRGLI